MAQAHVPGVDSVICREVIRLVSCTLDELAQRLSVYSWAQVLAAVDRLSRQGTLTLRRATCASYVGPIKSDPPLQSSQSSNSQALFGQSG